MVSVKILIWELKGNMIFRWIRYIFFLKGLSYTAKNSTNNPAIKWATGSQKQFPEKILTFSSETLMIKVNDNNMRIELPRNFWYFQETFLEDCAVYYFPGICLDFFSAFQYILFTKIYRKFEYIFIHTVCYLNS